MTLGDQSLATDAVRAIYRDRIAPLADPLLSARRQALRAGLPGGLVALAGLVAAGWMVATHQWPSEAWWSQRDTLVRLAMAGGVAIAALMAGGAMARPAAARQQHAEARLQRDVLPAAFAALRPGAGYKPGAALGERWMSRSALVKAGNRYESAHEVRWRAGDLSIRLAHVLAERSTVSVSRDTSTTTVHFKGEVAVVELPVPADGYVRVRAKRCRYEPPPEVSGLASVEASFSGLADAYEVQASSPAHAAVVLTPRLSRLLTEAARQRRVVHLAVAHREVFVAFERDHAWFDRLPDRFGEDHVVEMAAGMDLVECLAREVVAGLRAARPGT